MSLIETTRLVSMRAGQTHSWIGYAPLALLPLSVVACRDLLPPWVFMWGLCFAIYAGLKWLTWWKARGCVAHPRWRSVAYLLAWPGMGAAAFLSPSLAAISECGDSSPLSLAATRCGGTPGADESAVERAGASSRTPKSWLWAFVKTALGAGLIWIVARRVPAHQLLARGWVGMLGLIMLLHFGSFELVALFWQRLGVNAAPIMSAPLHSTSLGEFWGSRWNLGFRQLAHDLIFRPLQRSLGAGAAGFLVFIVSGLIHESVISLPARGGSGLPTSYFALQGVGVAIERSAFGKRLGLRQGWRGWLFTAAVTAGPVFALFHPWFVQRVIIPFLEAIHAL